MVKISAQSEHFSVLVIHSKFKLFKPFFRPKLNADPTGSGSETLLFIILDNNLSLTFDGGIKFVL